MKLRNELPVLLRGQGIYSEYLPAFFDPCETLIQGVLVDPSEGSQVLEHSIEKLSDGSYNWGQHHGGANLDIANFTVGDDGLVSGVTTNSSATKISYGPLTEQQLALFN